MHGSPGDPQLTLGLVDLPREQRRSELRIDLDAGGAVVVAGAPRTGRTGALRTVVSAAVARYGPDDLHLYAIDAAGNGLADLAALPHAGTVLSARDGIEPAARLIARLADALARTAEAPPHRTLVLIDGWEQLVAAGDEYDGGRSIEQLLGLLHDLGAARATAVIAGGRAVLAPRLGAAPDQRLVLPMHDRADYVLAGIDLRALPQPSPGRGVRVGDGAEFQLASARRTLDSWCTTRRPDSIPKITVRSLPAHVRVAQLTRPRDRWLLGAGGDDAGTIAIDLDAGARRLLIAGPTRSGRTTVLCSLLHQSRAHALGAHVIVAAPLHSALARLARELGVQLIGPGDDPQDLEHARVLLLDDAESFTDSAAGAALTRWLGEPHRIAVAAGRTDELSLAYRGPAAEIRRARVGLLLQPGPLDGELLGVRLPRTRSVAPTGRGVLITDPAWQLGAAQIQIQIALP